MIERGTLALIVGPSGVGKDSLIALAKTSLADNPRFAFPSRAISRLPNTGPESHVALSESEFETAEAYGAFLLSWRAHGVAYGIPQVVADDLERDCVVIASVSRSVIAIAETLVRSVRVIHVTASRELLRQRLVARGREPPGAIAQRLERTIPMPPTREPMIEIDNSGAIEIASRQLADVLHSLTNASARSVR